MGKDSLIYLNLIFALALVLFIIYDFFKEKGV